jgi:two-component system response regulator FixJ
MTHGVGTQIQNRPPAAAPGSSGGHNGADIARSGEPVVYIVDDEEEIRTILRRLIESIDMRVQTCTRATEFLDAYESGGPRCLLLDVRMPGMSGLDLQAELAARKISIPIIVLTGYAEVDVAVRTLKAGAFDFIEKPFSHQTVLDGVRKALAADAVTRQMELERAEITAHLARLTPRQREVLEQLLAGKTSKMIAGELGLSVKTVDVHRMQIMTRLNATSLAHLFHLMSLATDTTWRERAASSSMPAPQPTAGVLRRPSSRGGASRRTRHGQTRDRLHLSDA